MEQKLTWRILILLQFFFNFSEAKKKDCESIVYRFPKEVDSLITNYIVSSATSDSKKGKSTTEYYIAMSMERDTALVMICERAKSGAEIEYLLSRTNRVVNYKAREIPVIVREDLKFCSEFTGVNYYKDGISGTWKHIFRISGQIIKFIEMNNETQIISYEYFYP